MQLQKLNSAGLACSTDFEILRFGISKVRSFNKNTSITQTAQNKQQPFNSNFNSVCQTIPKMVFLRALILFLVLQDCTEMGFTAPSGLLKSLLTNLISEDNSLLTNLIEEDNPMKLFGSLGNSRKLSMTLLLI